MTVMMFCDTAVLRGELQCGGAEFRPPCCQDLPRPDDPVNNTALHCWPVLTHSDRRAPSLRAKSALFASGHLRSA